MKLPSGFNLRRLAPLDHIIHKHFFSLTSSPKYIVNYSQRNKAQALMESDILSQDFDPAHSKEADVTSRIIS